MAHILRTIFAGLLAALALMCLNAGTVFAQWPSTSVTADIRALATLPNGTVIAGGDSGKIYFSSDGGTKWTILTLGVISKVTAFASRDNTVWAGTQGSGVFWSTDGGLNWTSFNSGLTNNYIASLLAGSDGFLYAGTDASPGMLRSPISNPAWIVFNDGLAAPFVNTIVDLDSAILVGTTCNFGCTETGVFRLTKGQTTWRNVGNLPTGGSKFVYSLLLSPDGRTIYAGTFFGVHESVDGGDHWTQVSGLPHARTWTLAKGGENLFASMERGGVFRSQDYGLSWKNFNDGLTPQVQAFAFTPDLKWGFAGTSGGLYRHGFPLIPWPFLGPMRVNFPTAPGVFGFGIVLGNEGIRTDTISTMTVKNTNPVELKLNAVTRQAVPVGGHETALRYTLTLTRESVPGRDTIWAEITTQGLKPASPFSFATIVTKLPRTAVDEKPGELPPLTYALEQNYPNPFNPTTAIQFALPQATYVRLTIYDVLGHAVRTLVDGDYLAAGRHEVQWDGRDKAGMHVESGVYFLRVTAGSFSATRKMSLLK